MALDPTARVFLGTTGMPTTSLAPVAESPSSDSSGWQCPICLRSFKDARRAKDLYQVPVCRKCRNAFANRRQAAYLVDAAIWWLLATLTAGLLGLIFFSSPSATAIARAGTVPARPEYVTLLVLALIEPFVFGTLKDGFSGRSPGKFLFGLQVIDVETREPIGFLQAFKRNLILVVPYLNIVGLIGGVITMMGGRRWGDGWARTQVIWLKHKHKLPFSPDELCCRTCGYDLTGNVSGRCPECGREVPLPPAQPGYCPACGGDITDNVSGRCEQCGAEILQASEPQAR